MVQTKEITFSDLVSALSGLKTGTAFVFENEIYVSEKLLAGKDIHQARKVKLK